MRAEQPHRLARRRAHRRQAEPACTSASTMPSGVSPGWMTRAVMPSVQAEADTSSAAERAVVVRPVAGLELVLDQAVGGLGVGHPQQRLGQHHQRQALLGGKRVGVQEILHPAEPADAARGSPSPVEWRGHRYAPRPRPDVRRPPARRRPSLRPPAHRKPGTAECRWIAAAGFCRRHGSASKLKPRHYPKRAIARVPPAFALYERHGLC